MVIKIAFLLKRFLGGRAILELKPFVRPHMDVELIVDVPVGSADVGNVKSHQITRFFQNISARGLPADFIIDNVVFQGQRPS